MTIDRISAHIYSQTKNAFQSNAYHPQNTYITKTFKIGSFKVDMTFTLNDNCCILGQQTLVELHAM